MKSIHLINLSILVSTVALFACTSTGVTPVDGNTFMIAKKSAQVGFGPPIKTEAAVYAEASEFCEKQHNKVETVDLVVRNSTFGRPGSVNLKYRCVALNAPENPTSITRTGEGNVDQPSKADQTRGEGIQQCIDVCVANTSRSSEECFDKCVD